MYTSLKDGFVLGVEVWIRELSEACRTLALRVLSCFYSVVFAISGHERAYHQNPPTTHYHHHTKRQFNLFLWQRPVFEVWVKSTNCPIFDLQFQVQYFKNSIKTNKQRKKKTLHKYWDSVHFLDVIKVFWDSCVCLCV